RGEERPDARAYSLSDLLHLGKAAAFERLDDGLAARQAVVPAQRDPAHQVRVRRLDPVDLAERAGEPADAALATDAADLDHVGDGCHRLDPSESSASACSIRSGSCVAQMTVAPVVRATSARSAPSASALAPSSRAVGSSATITRGRTATARAR